MNHGFSVSLMTGRGLQAGATSLSVYTNQMRYLVTDNLILNSRIHLVQPGIMSSTQQTGQNLLIYYQAGMDWQPLKNLRIHLGISNLPRLQRYYYGNPMWYSAYPQGGRTLDPSTTMD